MQRRFRIHRQDRGSARTAWAREPAVGWFASMRRAVAREVQRTCLLPCVTSGHSVFATRAAMSLRGRCLGAGKLHPSFDRSTEIVP